MAEKVKAIRKNRKVTVQNQRLKVWSNRFWSKVRALRMVVSDSTGVLSKSSGSISWARGHHLITRWSRLKGIASFLKSRISLMTSRKRIVCSASAKLWSVDAQKCWSRIASRLLARLLPILASKLGEIKTLSKSASMTMTIAKKSWKKMILTLF